MFHCFFVRATRVVCRISRIFPLVAVLMLLTGPLLYGTRAHAAPPTMDDLAALNDKLIQTSVGYGDIPSLYRPRYGQAADMDLSMDKQEPVFVVMLPNGPHIYPQRIMVWHQVVNELIDDIAYAITYCPITGCLAAYVSGLNGLNLLLDADGRLYDGNSVLIDRNTGSLWLQILGMSFDGQLMGRGLNMLPVFWTTWSAAYSQFPDAKVLVPPPGSKRSYYRDPYGDYLKKDSYYFNDTLIYPVRFINRDLPRKNPVQGYEIDGYELAIDITYVKKMGAVNFFMGDLPLVAVHDKKLDVVRLYNRQIWDKPSLFVMKNNEFLDIATQTKWDAATGKAVSGAMTGASMPQYYGIYSMWFAWYDLHPSTLLIPGKGEVPQNLLQITPLDQDPLVGIPPVSTPAPKQP